MQTRRTALCALSTLAFSACAVIVDSPEPVPAQQVNIPKGHYPPPGECRIWYPNRPPGHQPPPMRCDRARAEVPPGAWVIRHPDDDPEHVHVAVYDTERRGSILVVGQFKIATGVFVRVVVNR
jgi:hypothetical protein